MTDMAFAGADTATEQYLSFELAGEQYALGILQVKEILRYETVTAVPGAPLGVHGVLNLRGAVVPIIDLAVRLGLAPTAVGARTCIVVVETLRDGVPLTMGVLVDAVRQVLDVAEHEIQSPPDFGTGVAVDHLRGMVRQGGRFALLLALDTVLSRESLAESAAGAAEWLAMEAEA
jgi:purine-binding chemotaxis protein CheW